MGKRKNRSPEEMVRRAKIRELLQESNISSMEDIQELFKETIGGADIFLDSKRSKQICIQRNKLKLR